VRHCDWRRGVLACPPSDLAYNPSNTYSSNTNGQNPDIISSKQVYRVADRRLAKRHDGIMHIPPFDSTAYSIYIQPPNPSPTYSQRVDTTPAEKKASYHSPSHSIVRNCMCTYALWCVSCIFPAQTHFHSVFVDKCPWNMCFELRLSADADRFRSPSSICGQERSGIRFRALGLDCHSRP